MKAKTKEMALDFDVLPGHARTGAGAPRSGCLTHDTAEAQRLLARALGAPELSAAEAFKRFAAGLGLPTSLEAVGVGEDQFELIARNTMKEFFICTNSRKVTQPAEVIEMLKLAAH